MDETTSTATTSTSSTTDDRARTWAFTSLGLALAALMGGGMLSNGVQTILLDSGSVGPWPFALTLVAAPLVMGALALWLGSNAAGSDDALARPMGRAAQTIAGLSILGAILVLIATATRSM